MPNVELARQEWEQGDRRLRESASDQARQALLIAQVEALVEQLRRRVGATYTLADLAREYEGAERWAYETLAERAERPGWVGTVSTALEAAFHRYARGAQDYRP